MASKNKDVKKYLRPKFLLFFALVIFAAIFIWYKSLPSFQEKMDQAVWAEYRNDYIGYSFEAPEFWQYSVSDYRGTESSSQYDAKYVVSAKAFTGPYFDVYFYKDFPEGTIESLMKPHESVKYELETKTINGIEYRQLTMLEGAYRTQKLLAPKDQI